MNAKAAKRVESERRQKEADHHPYRRPVDAATLILVDRSGSDAESSGRQTP